MIYDCSLFYDEFMLLDIRLAELWPVVDKFVILESNKTFSGKPKPLYFSDQAERYAPYKDKLVPVVFAQSNPSADRWVNDYAQRNALGDYLKTVCQPDDIIILTDGDEIIAREAVELLSFCLMPVRLSVKMYYYYFNCRLKKDWLWPVVCRYEDFLKRCKGSCQSLRISYSDTQPVIPNAGWHFSYIMQPARIVEKLGAFAHSEYDTPKWCDLDRIEACRRNHTDLFERPDHIYEITGLDDLPEAIRKHPEDYAEFLA